jgi:hypothetical protein
MRKASGYYLIVLGTLEITLYFMRNSVPFIMRPYAALLWSSLFVESAVFSSIFSLLICVLLIGAGVGLLTNRKTMITVYCIAGGLIAIVDLHLPVAVLMSGGSHVLSANSAGVMLLTALFYDFIPVSLSIWLVTHSARPSHLPTGV